MSDPVPPPKSPIEPEMDEGELFSEQQKHCRPAPERSLSPGSKREAAREPSTPLPKRPKPVSNNPTHQHDDSETDLQNQDSVKSVPSISNIDFAGFVKSLGQGSGHNNDGSTKDLQTRNFGMSEPSVPNSDVVGILKSFENDVYRVISPEEYTMHTIAETVQRKIMMPFEGHAESWTLLILAFNSRVVYYLDWLSDDESKKKNDKLVDTLVNNLSDDTGVKWTKKRFNDIQPSPNSSMILKRNHMALYTLVTGLLLMAGHNLSEHRTSLVVWLLLLHTFANVFPNADMLTGYMDRESRVPTRALLTRPQPFFIDCPPRLADDPRRWVDYFTVRFDESVKTAKRVAQKLYDLRRIHLCQQDIKSGGCGEDYRDAWQPTFMTKSPLGIPRPMYMAHVLRARAEWAGLTVMQFKLQEAMLSTSNCGDSMQYMFDEGEKLRRRTQKEHVLAAVESLSAKGFGIGEPSADSK